MIAGDSKPKLLLLQDPYGANLSYADKASFQAAGWDLTWRDVDGTAIASQPTWTIAAEGNGLHRVKYVVPAGFYWVEPTLPAGYLIGTQTVAFAISPAAWANEGQAFDIDIIGGLLLTAQGVPALISADDGNLGDIVNGDTWSSGTQTIPAGKLTPYGYTAADLASGWTISAGFRTAPNVPATAVLSGVGAGNGITAAFVVAASGTYKVSWTTFPANLALAATDEYVTWYMDVQLKKTSTGEILTVARWTVKVVWQRDTTA